MKTYPILKEDGKLHAFEITSAWLTFRPIYRVLRALEGVTNIKRNWFSDDPITFIYHGEPFVINEPWGDNSRYWIGPKDPKTSKIDAAACNGLQVIFWSHDADQRHEPQERRSFRYTRDMDAGPH